MRRPWPLEGGKEGSANYLDYTTGNGVVRVGRTPRIELADGDSATVVTAAGGGYGNPFERDPARVLDDVLDGYVSLERARAEYGVVIEPGSLVIDATATAALRANGTATG